MEVLELPGWRIKFDRAATAAAHARAAASAPQPCNCDPCSNWAATRAEFLPRDFLELLNRLGIPFDHEAEVYHNCRLESGLHSYGAWYHFIGEVLFGEKECSPFVTYGPLSLYFCSPTALLPEAFAGQPAAQLEILAEIPWLSDFQEPV